MVEYCESVMKKKDLGEQFFEDTAVVPSITIFSQEPGHGFLCRGVQKAGDKGRPKEKG